jgi:hypothetical protein
VALDDPDNKKTAPGSPIMDAKTLLILVLIVAAGVLGYLYYDSQKHGLVIDTPGVKIEAK